MFSSDRVCRVRLQLAPNLAGAGGADRHTGRRGVNQRRDAGRNRGARAAGGSTADTDQRARAAPVHSADTSRNVGARARRCGHDLAGHAQRRGDQRAVLLRLGRIRGRGHSLPHRQHRLGRNDGRRHLCPRRRSHRHHAPMGRHRSEDGGRTPDRDLPLQHVRRAGRRLRRRRGPAPRRLLIGRAHEAGLKELGRLMAQERSCVLLCRRDNGGVLMLLTRPSLRA